MTRAAALWTLLALFAGRDQRWTGDLIPLVFHIVLAGFLLDHS